MAGVIVTPPRDPMITNVDWSALLDEFNTYAKGHNGINLTNWVSSNTNKPEIANGSFIEVNSSWIEFDSDTPITNEVGLASGLVYLMIDTTGGTVTSYLTNTAPVWKTDFNGYYDSTDNNKRYTGHAMTWDGATLYTVKKFAIDKEMLQFIYVGVSN